MPDDAYIRKSCVNKSCLGEIDVKQVMDEQDFLNRIAQSMKESENQLLHSLGRTSSRATREQAFSRL